MKSNSVSMNQENQKIMVEDMSYQRNRFDNSITSTHSFIQKVSAVAKK